MTETTTKSRLLDVAEQLLSVRGPEATSLRAINTAAGMNPAAVHYHFGSRERLIEEVLLRRMRGLMARRAVLLDALDARPDVHGLVRVLAQPLAELQIESPEIGRRYLLLLSRIYAARSSAPSAVVSRYFGAEMGRWLERLERALPELPRAVLLARVAIMTEALVHGLAHADTLAAGLPFERYLGTLIDSIAGALSAPDTFPSTTGETT